MGAPMPRPQGMPQGSPMNDDFGEDDDIDVDNDMDLDMNDSDDEQDPKKHIQKLCGSLSQELRQYNQDQEKPDTELNKYVAGMIIPQATKNMTQNEKDRIIKKINSGESSNVDDDNEDLGVQDDDMGGIPKESRRLRGYTISELNTAMFNDEDKKRLPSKGKKLKMGNPFISNR